MISFKIDWFDLLVSKGSLESSPAPQFKGINSLALCLLYGPALTTIYDHWEDHSLEYMIRSITTNKASGDDGSPAELFQILEGDAITVLHLTCQQIWKTQQWPQDWKRSFFIPIPKKGSAKECSNYWIIALISHASKVMLKILQARLQQYVS